MINIPFNQNFFEVHVKNLTEKVNNKIKSFDKTNLSINTICCLNEIYINSEVIIKANIKELQKIIKYFESKFYCSIGYEENKQTELYITLSKIFIDDKTGLYKNFSNAKKNEYNAYQLVQSLNLKTCPYCNRNYIPFVKNDEKKTRPQLDHFYPKAIYPFLACSFYNLIPSCSTCNHMKSDEDSYKDEKNGELVHPYNVKNDDFTFSYTFDNLDILKSIDKKNIRFEDEEKIKITLDTKYKKNNKYFQLEEIYQNHRDLVIELILKEINYPKSYIEELVKNGFGTQEEIYRFIFSNYLEINNFHKRPLSKLTYDIINELGITDKIHLSINSYESN
ncbi:hypothetical protein ACNSOL_01520 [Aliarcobacter lanthieri]|uniref:hypothetical protein n=1 Tax=Aliarcobacter lanthieri TaxID=1355374 RepID=UPI003AAA5DFD